MMASSCPRRTIWPSLNSTCCSTPDTCARTVAVAIGVTVPSASICTGKLSRLAAATPTVAGGRPRGMPAFSSGGFLPAVTYQTSAAMAPTKRISSSQGSQRRRWREGGRLAWRGALAGVEGSNPIFSLGLRRRAGRLLQRAGERCDVAGL